MMNARRLSCLVLFLPFLVVMPAFAAESAPASETGDVAEQARVSFRRGVELYEERDFGGAGVEFRRAYQLAKNFRILYNLARVAVEEHDYAAAVDLFGLYLADGGDQISPERTKEVRGEISSLNQRVARVDVSFDSAGAAVFVDDIEKAIIPLRSPIAVNVGRRHVEVRPRTGAPLTRWIDAPGGETVKVRFATASTLDDELTDSSVESAVRPHRSTGGARKHASLWLPWTATAACAVGATIAGVLGYQASRDLSDLRQTHPVTRSQLDDKQRSARIAGFVSDGLSVATVALAALSLYWTLDQDQSNTPRTKGASVSIAWPGTMVIDGHF